MSEAIAPSAYHLDATEPDRPAPIVVPDVRNAMSPLQRRTRRRQLRKISLLLAVLLPTAAVGAYLYGYASDQYVTEFRVSVRHESPLRMEPTAMSSVTAPPAGSGSPLTVITDSQIVVQYLKSRQVVDDLATAGIDLEAIYAGPNGDYFSHLDANSTAEERQRYLHRAIDPFFDLTTGLISVEVHAFSPADAHRVAITALRLAEKVLNDVSDRAHADEIAYLRTEVDTNGAKLQAAQAAIAAYRNQHAVLFPDMQATGETTLEGRVQENLIEAKTGYNAQIAMGASKESIPMRTLANRIASMEAERQAVHGHLAQSEPGNAPASLASVMSEYEVLRFNVDIAAKVYERSLTGLQDARNAASQQGIYLASFVRPSLPDESTYPVRWRVLLETALFSFVGWCLLQLIYHGVRDHIE